MDIKEAKILIVEDELDKREFIFRILTDAQIPVKQIKRASHTKAALNLIKEFEPDLILLDISIPREENGIAEPENVGEVLSTIRLFNLESVQKIRTIIISGTVKQKVIQDIIGSLNKQTVFDFIDKIEIAKDIYKFKQNLIKKIQKALNTDFSPQKIDYWSIADSKIKRLNQYNESLWLKIKNEVLDEFEKLDEKNVNEYTTSKSIIKACGEIVEIIVNLMEKDLGLENPNHSSDDYVSIRNKLTSLSGRIYDIETRRYKTEGKQLISRKMCFYASQIFLLRSYASHAPEADRKNENIFYGIGFTKEDAAISINLLVPVIIEYLEILKNK